MTARSAAPLVAMMVGLGMTLGAPSANADKAGHALAQRFVDGAAEEAKRKEAEDAKRRAAEEAEMLARARAEAEERKAAAAKARAQEEAREARRLAEEERARKARLAEEQRRAREQFIAEQLRAAEKAAEERERAQAARIAAEKRRAEDERKRAEAARKAEEKRIADERRAAEEETRRLAEEQRNAREKVLAAERQAEEERRRAEAARIAEEKRLAEEKRVAAEARRAEQHRQALAAEHDAAHARRAERMRQLERERQARERMAAKPPEIEPAKAEPLGIDPPMGLGVSPSDRAGTKKPAKEAAPHRAMADTRPTAPPERVTILISIEPGKTGIRRFGKKTADPVLCAGHTCWIAAGADRAAREVTRGLALGPANTMGRRAAACNRHLTCVFRDVDLDAPSADIQPIDLRILRHDRRKPLRLEADPSCRLVNGTLACDKLFVARSWRAWVIDEELARKAGPEVLEGALKRGLAPARSAALDAEHY